MVINIYHKHQADLWRWETKNQTILLPFYLKSLHITEDSSYPQNAEKLQLFSYACSVGSSVNSYTKEVIFGSEYELFRVQLFKKTIF